MEYISGRADLLMKKLAEQWEANILNRRNFGNSFRDYV